MIRVHKVHKVTLEHKVILVLKELMVRKVQQENNEILEHKEQMVLQVLKVVKAQILSHIPI